MEGSSVPEQRDVEYPSMPDYTGAKIAEDVAAMGELSEPAAPVRPVQSSPIAEDIAEQARQNLNASLVGVRTVNPDEAAKAMRLGRQLDLPPEVVRADMRRAEEQEYLDRLRSRDILRNDPVLANYLANREFANIAHDDIDNLTAIERTFKFFRDIPTGLSEGFTKAVSQAEMADIIERQRQRGGYLEEYEKAALDSYSRELAALSVETGLAEAGSYLFSQQLTGWKQEDIDIILAGGVIGGGAGLVGGPLAPATVPAGMALGLKAGLSTALVNRSLRMERALLYAELEPELGNDLANQIATGVGVLNASLDVGALGIVTKPLREPFKAAFRQSVKEAVKKQTVRQAFGRFGLWYAGSAATEVGTETLQELNNVLGMELGLYLQDKPLVLTTEEGRAEVADRLANIAAETALGMVTVGLPGPAFQFYADVRRSAKATRDHKLLENITKTVAESKVLPRDAATMEQYLASTAAGTDAETTYIDAAVAHDILRQSGLTELEMDAVLPGVRQQIEQYQSDGITLVGADVTIPTAQFAARLAKTPLQSQLLPHARLSADAPSLVEAQRIRAEHDQRRAEAEQIIAQQEATNGTFVQEAREIEDTLASQIQATGQMDERASRSSAQFMRDFYVTQAASMGLTPKQVYERFPVRVEGEGMAAPAAPLEQSARSQLQTRASQLGIPATTSNAAMQRDIDILTRDPKTWSREDFDAVKNLLAIHQDVRPGAAERSESIMREGLRSGMVDSIAAMEEGRWTWAGELVGGEAYVFPYGTLRFRSKDDPNLAAGNIPLFKITPKRGQNLYEAIKESAVLNPAGIPVAPSSPMEQAATLDADYLAAVERGDMATAQRETDLAAEMSMPQSAVRGDGEIGAAGKLLRVFHGSGAFIRQFMYEFTGQGVDQLGSGFYFTTDRDEAVSYTTRRGQQDLPKLGGEDAPTVVEAYLDIRNPLDASATGSINSKQVQKFIELAPEESRREGLENWGIEGDKPSTKVLNAYAFTDANIVRELFKIGNDFYGRNTEAFNRAIKQVLGYDGVVQDFRVDGVRKLHYVAFFPEQIKSADPVTYDESGNIVPLSRRFDITSPKLFEQAAMFEQAPVSLGFYSALAKAVDAIDAKSIAPAGWKERIKGLVNKGEIKQDEVEWSGLVDWLDMQDGKVTKDAVAEFLKNNGVRVERVLLGQEQVDESIIASMEAGLGSASIDLENAGAMTPDLQYTFSRYESELSRGGPMTPERRSRLMGMESIINPELEENGLPDLDEYFQDASAAFEGDDPLLPKFEKFTLPGGTNYREVLITLPRLPQDEFGTYLREMQRKYGEDYVANMTEEESARLDMLRQQPAGFRSTHWDKPNVLVHFRLNDRVDADGKRVLFVEEIQSDWGQQGRKVGFVPTATRRQAIIDEMTAAQAAFKAAIPGSDAQADAAERATRAEEAYNKEINAASIPRAPFVETTDGWLNLALKHILLEATQGNYDRVAFVNGKQSADRYDLSKQVEQISWDELTDVGRWNYGAPSATKVVTIRPIRGNLIDIPIDAQGIAVATGTTGNQFDGKPLDEIVPKEIAEQVMAERSGDIKGDGLKVGGRGMLEFYDKIVPAAVNKLLKKYGGGKLGTVEIDLRTPESEAWYREPTAEELPAQPGFPVTPEMVKKLESGLPLFQAMPALGAPRGGFDPRRLTTILNKTADLSTFLHESAHAFLTFYEQVAQMPDAPARIVNDLDEVLRWAGIAGDTPQARLATWNGMTLDQKRKAHEQFAYSFEVYLFEGKAPSAEMQGLFERFSAWLKRVYRSIRDDLNAIYRREFGEDLPILTGEVRQVMDRMLATDEQIARQAAINEMKPMFQTQAESGMSDAEWAAYQQMQQEAIEASVIDMNVASMRQMQWLGNARSRVLREVQKKHDARRKEVAVEIAAEVKVEPVYRAMTYLRTGKFVDADGAEVVVEGPHRLDTKRVKKLYETVPTAASLEAVRATGMPLPTVVAPDIAKLGTGKNGMMGLDGLDPDLVAETFGYSSGDEMIRALVAARPMKEIVAERTDAEMLRRFGDMTSPEAIEAEVQAALHNEARARFVAVELRYLSKATEPARVMVDAAKQVARDLIAGKRVRDVRPSDFVAAEARAARDASRIGSPVDAVAVGRAAYTRTYNERIAAGADEATAVAEATTASVEAARMAQERTEEIKARYGADPEQARIRAKRAQLYQNQLAAEALRVKAEVDKQVKYLRRVLRDENVKRMGAQAADQVAGLLDRFEVAAVSLKRLDERKALTDWLAEQEAAGLVPDIAPEIANEARRVNYREMKVSEFRDLVDAVKQIEFIGKNEQKLRLAEERAAFEEKRDEIVTRIRAAGKVRGLSLDPRTPLTGIGRAAAFLRGFAAQHLKAASIARVLDGGKEDGPLWNAIIRTANDASDMETTMRAKASLRLGEILKPVFALGGMGGKGMHFPSIGRSLNREARLAIALNMGNDGNRQRLLDGEGWTLEQIQPVLESLTEAEWQAVQQVWDFIDGYRPEIAAKERRLYGKEPTWVTPVPFTVRTVDGKEVSLQGGYYPIKYDPVASDRVATVDAAEEAKRDLQGAYTAATTRRSFVKARAKEVVDRPILYTLDAAFSGVNDVIHDLAWHEWLISTNRLLRDVKFANAVRETRGPEFLKQLRDWTKDNATGARGQQVAGESVLSWLRQGISASGLGFNINSAALQVTGFNQSIVRVGAKYVGQGITQFATSPFDSAKMVSDKSQFMAERGRTQFREINEIKNRVRGQTEISRRVFAGTYFLMMNMQRSVDIPTWLGAYQKALDAGKSDATAVALADQAVRDSQGSGLVSDLAAVERGGPAMKLFTVFYSYMNTVYNMAAVQTMTARGKGKLAADYAMLFVVPVVLGYAIKSLLQPNTDDEEFDPEALARKLAAEELSYMMGTMIIAREFGGAAQLLTGAEGVRMGYGGPAGLRAIGEVYGLATQAGQLEFDRAFRRSAVNTLGAFTGLPAAQINRTIDGIEAVVEGEVEGVGAVVAPLTGVQR